MSRCDGERCSHPECVERRARGLVRMEDYRRPMPDRYRDAGVVRDRILAVPAVKWDLMNRKERRELAQEGYYRAG